MNFTPHKLYRAESLPTQVDENGDVIPGTGGDTLVYLCGCFLHNVDTKIKQGYAGIGIEVTHYVNMDKRDDLKVGQEVLIVGFGSVGTIGDGKILDIKHTSGMRFAGQSEYTTIYI
jgi:hypothetical protein